ncbi:MAG: hypothetical protein J5641_02825 [Bacteroidales bacterium]|nr:hypothetical protein [Bacteroidales bacterium]
MTTEEFDNLWQEAEAEGMARRMAKEYPAWERKQRRWRNGIVAVAVCGLMTTATLPLLAPKEHEDYVAVYCNRQGTTDAQWVALAAEMLTTDRI